MMAATFINVAARSVIFPRLASGFQNRFVVFNRKQRPKIQNVYLLVRHVPFITRGAGFFQVLWAKILYMARLRLDIYKYKSTIVQRRACLEHFVHCSKNPALRDVATWQKLTDLFFRLYTLCTHLSGTNLSI